MSHYALCRTSIKNPSKSLLRSVLSKIATSLNAKVIENAEVYGWGFSRRVDFLIKMKLPFGNGYGVEVTDSGEVVIHVDDHGAPMTGKQFRELLQREYMAEAVKAVMEELGYVVEEDRSKDAVIIKAVGW